MQSGAMTTPLTPPRVAIVTGGARGLGRVIALALRAEGYAVTITASAPSAQLDETVATAAALPGGDGLLLPVIADAASPEAADDLVASTVERFGGLHAVVNNAGRGMRLISDTFTTEPVHFWRIPHEHWRTIMATNVDGPFLLAKAAMPHLLAQGEGRIVNVSTSSQTMIRPGYAPYGPSKAALEAMTRSWAADLDGSGVTVNLLLPGGAADTDLLPPSPERKGADGNLLDPAIMAAPAVWLCGPASGGVTGARVIARHWPAGADAATALGLAAGAHVVGV